MSQFETWSIPQLEREVAAYRGYAIMALNEVEAGNDQMVPFLEAYAAHLDAAAWALQQRKTLR